MILTNSSENRINWNLKIEQSQKLHTQRYVKSVANLIFCRGNKVFDERKSLEYDLFGLPQMYTKNYGVNLTAIRDSHRLFGHEKSVSVLSNNQSFVPLLDKTLDKATQMMMEGAYMHHYDKFGVSKDMFHQAFMNCESILAEYQSL